VKPSDSWGPLAETLLGAAAFDMVDVARESGVEPEEARRLWRALGFPPAEEHERLFTTADVQVLRAVRALVEGANAEPADVLQLTRVIGQSLARVADAQVTVVADRLERLRTEAPTGDPPVAEVVQRIQTLAPSLEQFLGYIWRRHLVAALRRRRRISRSPSASPTWSASPP
jgi:adenylate cyclase